MTPKALWHALVGDGRAPTSATHPDDHEPVWNQLGDEKWRACERCGHIDAGVWWDQLLRMVVMFGVVCIFAAWGACLAFSIIG